MAKYSFDKIEVDGFRGLKHLRLDDLGLINVLVGGNNSGKTSVLEALSILCSPFEPEEWLWMARRRDFGGLDETRIQSLRWCFTQAGQLTDPDTHFEGECVMSCVGRFPLRKLRVQYKDVLGEPDTKLSRRPGKKSSAIESDVEVDIFEPRRGAVLTHTIESERFSKQQTIFADETLSSRSLDVWEDKPIMVGRPRSKKNLIPTETLTPYSYQINRVQVRHQSKRIFDRSGEKILELVRDFDPEIEGIEIASFRGGRPSIYLNHKRLGPAPLSVFGDALRRAVLLASTLFSLKDGGLLLIDEIETGIHVSVLQPVFQWLTRTAIDLDVQIVATTHSLEAVDAIAIAVGKSSDFLVTYHLLQTEQETQVKRIDGELLLRLRRERGLDVR
jgi:hypothetical protein